jgi:hypothetical protein
MLFGSYIPGADAFLDLSDYRETFLCILMVIREGFPKGPRSTGMTMTLTMTEHWHDR